MTEIKDAIERSIVIDAPLQKVWNLISTPGWFINYGEVVDNELRYDGDQVTVISEVGEFVLEIVEVREPSYCAFRWLGGTTQPDAEQELQTLTEFRLREVAGGVEVIVTESGWGAYEPTDYVRKNYEENSHGWDLELAAAARRLA